MKALTYASTGITGLDEILNNLRMGDNVVWQVDNIEDYKYFVLPFVERAKKENRRIVYIHFSIETQILSEKDGIFVYYLDAYDGFETFSSKVFNIITEEGKDVFYVFDNLSGLLSAWATDLMIGNFFLVSCPYLYELNTVAYFAILKNNHSFKTVARIRETTQLMIDVYKSENNLYIHPLKVWNRYSPTMFLPHVKEGDKYIPIINSFEASKLFAEISYRGVESAKRNLDYWDRLFLGVEELIDEGASFENKAGIIEQIIQVMIGKEEKIVQLAKKYFTLKELLEIKSRLIGTGFIGGKAVGMLLARNILEKEKGFDWNIYLESHDSFYIGSDVFYSYIVQNGLWRDRMKQKTEAGYFEAAKDLRQKMVIGNFPEEIKEQFQQMLEYFGQSPIIVRSSSLLEDSFGNAFAGKYDSFFCVNQCNPEDRYNEFVTAVRNIYASTMSEDALSYRLQRGLSQQDEQMALLVQRVSGSYHKKYFYPELAGVGVSYNTFVWKENMDPRSGMLRLVFGLGTRAVDRVDDDYPRIVALDMPLLKPHAGIDDTRMFSQHKVDLLNIEKNQLDTVSLYSLMQEEPIANLDLFGIKDYEMTQKLRERGSHDDIWIFTFDELMSKTQFPSLMKNLMKTIENHYQYPVDIEFTVNFTRNREMQINLLQCRPLQTMGNNKNIEIDPNLPDERVYFRSSGNFMGGSILIRLKRVIYVDSRKYGELNLSQKYDIARLVGKLNKLIPNKTDFPVLLLGPGRWGTTTPSLGVSVNFSEINNMAVLGEISDTIAGLTPELSFGTHFFQDLVETGIFYVALFPEKKGVTFKTGLLSSMDNQTPHLVPELAQYADTVKVWDIPDNLLILSDLVSQQIVCYLEKD